jgi:hypothetical protein
VIFSANVPNFQSQLFEARQRCMSGRPRVYLAIGIFYETERLRAAANSLLASGFAPDKLWQLVLRDSGSAGLGNPGQKVAECHFELAPLPAEMLVPTTGLNHDGEGAELSDLRLDVLMAGNAGAEIGRHVEHGATVLVAGTEGAGLHDKCVKLLLRHSLHTVHSQEVSLPR